MSLVIGIPACAREFDDVVQYATPARYADAVVGALGALPIILPPVGEGMIGLLDQLDGLLLPGSPSNVEPYHYGVTTSLTPDRHDPLRDGTTLPLIRAAIARGIPLLAICRGHQELNVALGGTLDQQVQDLPGREDHRGEDGPLSWRYRPKHKVALTGSLAALFGKTETMVNSSHEQAIARAGAGLVVEAVADDGTIEAVRHPTAPGFVVGVQWHPEWAYAENADSLALFRAFGEACRGRLRKAA